MAPPRQITDEQLNFLQGHLASFLQYTLEKRQSTFWAILTEDWFTRWPELDALVTAGRLPPEAAEKDGMPYTWPEEHTKIYQDA
jgi:hypothetical protein